MIGSFLLFDGRQNETTLQMMNEEGVFARLLDLIQALRKDEMNGGAGLHRLLMDLLYEMSRIQRVKVEDLGTSILYFFFSFFFFVIKAWRELTVRHSARGR